MALKPENPVVGGNVLRRQAIESPNYTPGVSGWVIKQDGSAEFNNLTIRGTFNGTNFAINSSGAFFYSGAPAAGNLVTSITTAAGTDQFGNKYLANTTTYGATFAASLAGGFVQFYTGSLAAGWSAIGSIQSDALGDIFLLAAAGRSVTTNNNTLDDGAGHMTVTGLTVNGSTNTAVPVPNATSNNGIANGQITGTSGAASAGTAHTHGAGSYSVTDGHHSHDTQNHVHAL